MKTETLRNHYVALQKASGIEAGDTVRILRVCNDQEMGWGVLWNAHMDKTVGMKGTVRLVGTDDGIQVEFDREVGGGRCWWYPFFALGIVEKRVQKVDVCLNSEHTAEVYKDKIVVGCQTFDPSIIEKLAEAYKSLHTSKGRKR